MPKELWDMLKKRSFARNGPRMYELESTIGNCKQEGDFVLDYFAKINKMWDELADYEKAPNCCYGDLTRKRITDGKRQRKEKRLHKFLLCLIFLIHAINSQILNMNPIPSIDTGYCMIIREKRHVVIAQNQDAWSEVVAFVARVP